MYELNTSNPRLDFDIYIFPVGIEQAEPEDDQNEADEYEQEKDRFADVANLAEHFRHFAEALYAEDYQIAAIYVVPDIREAAIVSMKAERQRVLEDAQEKATDQCYLCEIRCEYGNNEDYVEGKIDAYVMVDALAVQTDDGPMLAGIGFL